VAAEATLVPPTAEQEPKAPVLNVVIPVEPAANLVFQDQAIVDMTGNQREPVINVPKENAKEVNPASNNVVVTTASKPVDKDSTKIDMPQPVVVTPAQAASFYAFMQEHANFRRASEAAFGFFSGYAVLPTLMSATGWALWPAEFLAYYAVTAIAPVCADYWYASRK